MHQLSIILERIFVKMLITIDIIGASSVILMFIFILYKLIKRNKSYSPSFYRQLLANNCCELCYIAMEYFLVRLPMFKLFQSFYQQLQTYNGFFYGFSTGLTTSIAFGQFILALNRFIVVKYPFFSTKCANFKITIICIIFQVMLTIPPSIFGYFQTGIVEINQETLIITMPLSNSNSTKLILLYATIIGCILTTLSFCVGLKTFLIIKRSHSNLNSRRSVNEYKLLKFVFFQIITNITIIILSLLQFTIGIFGLYKILIA
uniref:7TM GPCR serpentine receptor class x (Srx) domain-containing protein n=1 Tax=Strongyloides venezuelensis TaxID=75913 RepID=A0A0K0F3N3_STRVS